MKSFTKLFAGAAVAATMSTAALADDIVEVATEAGKFETLLAAAKAAGLVETLKGDGPLTVFAPTDEAFADVPEESLNALLKPENKEKLAELLTYHVVSGKVMSSDLEDGMQAESVEGSDILVDLKGKPMVNDAHIISADIEADNGVVHVIDKVIFPEGFTVK